VSEHSLLYRVEMWLVTRQDVELYPWMPGKPFLHGSELVNTARWATGRDAFEKLDELNRALSIYRIAST